MRIFELGATLKLITDSALGMPAPDTSIWRYMDIAKFLELISYRRLFFTNGSQLTDKHEGAVPIAIFQAKRRDLKKDGLSGRALEEVIAAFQHLEANAMISLALFNCWLTEDDESFALWKVYLGGQ